MPLVQYYKGARILKARSKRLKGRPAWQDVVLDTKQGRDTYKIAADNEKNFSRTFLKATRELLTPEILDEMLEALKRQSAAGVIAALPGSDEEDPAWEKFNESMTRAYAKVVQESGDAEMKNLNRQLGTKMKFEITVEKQEEDLPKVPMAPGVEVLPVVPINPYSEQWIRQRLREFQLQGITKPQKEVVMDILGDSFEQGIRPEAILEDIKANIGLTSRDFKAVQNRRFLHESAGLPTAEVDKLTDTYRDTLLTQRAQRIARTETIAAQANGRHTSWQLADEQGVLPKVQRTWSSAPESPNPNRPCEICLDLDGKTAPLNGTYDSIFLGPVEGPPAHTNCRCTETLQRV